LCPGRARIDEIDEILVCSRRIQNFVDLDVRSPVLTGPFRGAEALAAEVPARFAMCARSPEDARRRWAVGRGARPRRERIARGTHHCYQAAQEAGFPAFRHV